MSTFGPSHPLVLLTVGTLFAPASTLLLGTTVAGAFDVLQLVSQVNTAESEREADIRAISCTRRYVMRNKRWSKDAVMNVRVTSDASGKKYEILTMDAEGLQKRAFHKILEAEVEGSRKNAPDGDASISPSNYDFEYAGSETIDGKRYVVVTLKPKRNSKFLLDGKAWLDPQEQAVVRVEGRTAKSVSFWIGKPQITQSFHKVDDIWVSATNKSMSDVRFLGKTELSIEFTEYDIVSGARHVARNSASGKR